MADVMVIGDGVLGLSIAIALGDSPSRPTVTLVGRPGPGASAASGAMLSVLGELTGTSLRTPVGRARVDLAVRAAARWPAWRDRVREVGRSGEPDGFGSGAFLVHNSASSTLDDDCFAAVEAFANEEHRAEHVDPCDISGYRPFERDRALLALHLPDERFLDARAWLSVLEAALAAMPNVSVFRHDDPRPEPADRGFAVRAGDVLLRADRVVVAAGVWTPRLVAALAPGANLMPVFSGAGTGLRVHAPFAFDSVLRTPNRAFACGLHVVPQADGTAYLGGTNNVTLTPESAPTLSNLHHLSESFVDQFHQHLSTAAVMGAHFGNRPVALDGHPLLGATEVPGLWVATGTFREGVHLSPLIAEQIAAEVLDGDSALPQWFRPDRAPLAEWTRADAIAEAARHLHAVAVETRLRPPIMGRWPDHLRDMYELTLTRAYDALPNGFVLPPELAPLAYEHGGKLAEILSTSSFSQATATN